jgi:hypothetical protein
MTTATEKAATSTDVQPISTEAILEQFGSMLMAIPLAEDDDGTGILLGILQANTPEDLNVGGKLPEAEDMLGKDLVIRSIERRESTLEDNEMGYYLVVRGTEGPHQTPFVFGTGSKGITAALVKLYAHGWLPALCKVEQSPKETKKGFRPLNLRVVSVPGSR